MPDSTGSLPSAAEFSLLLDAAKARAQKLRQEAIRDFGSSLLATFAAAGRRLARSLRPAGPARPVRRASHLAR